MTRLRVRENGTVKKRRDSKHAKDVLDEAQAHHKLEILAMMALFAQQQDIDPTPYLVFICMLRISTLLHSTVLSNTRASHSLIMVMNLVN